MEVLLTKDVDGLGTAGELKRVKPGYARNYLLPRGLALPATPGLRKQSDQIRGARNRRTQRELIAARSLAQRIQATVLTFSAHAGESGRLYGSITTAAIAEKLSEAVGQEIDRRRIRLEHPLRDLGSHDVVIHVAQGVDATFRVVVNPEGALEQERSLSDAQLAEAAANQGVETEEA